MTITSSTGGHIIPTSTGLIHYCNTERFTDEFHGNDQNGVVGRPTKISVEEGLKFDFGAFLTPVRLTGTPVRVVKF